MSIGQDYVTGGALADEIGRRMLRVEIEGRPAIRPLGDGEDEAEWTGGTAARHLHRRRAALEIRQIVVVHGGRLPRHPRRRYRPRGSRSFDKQVS